MSVGTLGVVGCGLMGSGIAEVAAKSGLNTVVREINEVLLERGRGLLQKSLATGVDRGKLSEAERDAALSRLTFVTELDGLSQCDVVIEAATENPTLKKEIFAALDAACKPETILASNTSSIPIIELAASTKRPKQVVGMHFFNPVPVMKLVEVISTIVSDEPSVQTVKELAAILGKKAVLVKDRAGFVVNVLLIPYLLDAVRLVEQGVSTREDIDEAMRLGCGYPMGPLQLLDFVGIDTTYYIAEIMFDEFKDPKFAPPTLLKHMNIAGLHGRKTGRGFYDYAPRD